ncbi:hypothetical protein GBA52_000567 [Prunus armeniaca]|nr:hypothetical protein GBA52_000567 [Prunus armeniaca]
MFLSQPTSPTKSLMGYSVSTTSSFSHFFSVPPPLHTYTIKNGATIPFLSLSSMPLPRLYLRRRVPQDAPFHLASETTRRASSTTRNVKAQASLPDPPSSSSNTKRVVLVSALTIALAVANRVLYKLALVPMKNHPFFLAQFTTFGYVIIYFSILFARYRSGIVTDEMIGPSQITVCGHWCLGSPWSCFWDGCCSHASRTGNTHIESVLLLLLRLHIVQTFLVWQLSFSVLLLGRTYTFNQISGCILVAIGVAVAVTSGSDSGQMLSGVESMWPVLMIASSAFQAGASIIKLMLHTFSIHKPFQLQDKSLDIFVVNSFGSGFQLVASLVIKETLPELQRFLALSDSD